MASSSRMDEEQKERLSEIELDLSQWPIEAITHLLQESCDKDISINKVITNILEEMLKKVDK